MTRALVNVPKTAKRGEIIEIRAMIQHVMETGYREGPNGVTLPRNIIKRFVCKYGAEEIFSAELFPAIAANPYMAFSTVATESGTLTFEWTDDKGATQSASAEITVT
ncbi:thiosulfate oxidation carrier complex protein SoxZ [Steroidobacter agaridevorans]|uniref:Thiosulfate oxidation carrier complex protein SoxZ n=1 Tax=Steroidobacter agaridevorans TaxID=2695856 RepID=A0A829YBI0_9GAMM|nr:thiosulfate oxidation carrier complex protein SoxZ [Steroidobacter agaridevorans]GFE80313.1 thiosulfate oxidation carrier complex protein SoxZ [Steroidobacter agaridevorans]GFE87366.1 thiosulfate oxidation carrier complex protein SoxZ [Steroidobacter agaridevorans]